MTRANDRGTVTAKVGDRIQIALGSDFEWRLDPPDGVVLVRGVQNEALVRGTQAIWTAAAPGTATISATGTVVCPSGQACILIVLMFTTTVVVSGPYLRSHLGPAVSSRGERDMSLGRARSEDEGLSRSRVGPARA